MKQILYPLLATTFALSLSLPVGIVWAGLVAPVCSANENTTCLVKEGDSYCSLPEDVPKNTPTLSSKGQLERVVVNTPQTLTHKCAAWEHPKAE